jgi:hypothetical protein
MQKFDWKSSLEDSVGRPKRKWKGNIKISLRLMRFEQVNLNELNKRMF